MDPALLDRFQTIHEIKPFSDEEKLAMAKLYAEAVLSSGLAEYGIVMEQIPFSAICFGTKPDANYSNRQIIRKLEAYLSGCVYDAVSTAGGNHLDRVR